LRRRSDPLSQQPQLNQTVAGILPSNFLPSIASSKVQNPGSFSLFGGLTFEQSVRVVRQLQQFDASLSVFRSKNSLSIRPSSFPGTSRQCGPKDADARAGVSALPVRGLLFVRMAVPQQHRKERLPGSGIALSGHQQTVQGW
jgi:hypothetical protein